MQIFLIASHISHVELGSPLAKVGNADRALIILLAALTPLNPLIPLVPLTALAPLVVRMPAGKTGSVLDP